MRPEQIPAAVSPGAPKINHRISSRLAIHQRPAKPAQVEAHFPEVSAHQITKHRPAIEAELFASGEREVKDHASLYGFNV
ncbi:MAG: hypothetical protein QM760_07920 [Nibricoccus sp.]